MGLWLYMGYFKKLFNVKVLNIYYRLFGIGVFGEVYYGMLVDVFCWKNFFIVVKVIEFCMKYLK